MTLSNLDVERLQNLKLEDVEVLDYAYLTFATCSTNSDGCGWSGWIIEAAFKASDSKHNTYTGDKLLNADYSQKCPKCDGLLFRTEVSCRLDKAKEQ